MGLRRIAIYTGLRFALFAVAFGLLWAVLRGVMSVWVLALLALLISSVASLFLLRGQAEAAGREFAGGLRAAKERFEEAKRREDDDDDPDAESADDVVTAESRDATATDATGRAEDAAANRAESAEPAPSSDRPDRPASP